MAMKPSRDAHRWLVRAPDIANLVLIAFIALALARLFWLVWPAPSEAAIAPSDQQHNGRAASSASIDIDSITAAYLFGEQASEDATAEKQKQIKAPETHLKLELTGIVSDSRGSLSRAFIKGPKGQQDSYRVDQQIISGVKLHAVYADRVILDRSGHYETLTLESIKKRRSMAGVKRTPASAAPSSGGLRGSRGSGPSDSDDGDQPTRTVSGDVADRIAAARQKILSDPSSASRYLRLQPARQNGNLVGYRIYPGENKTLFEKAGLQSGEMVTAINGKPLDNPAASLKLLGSLSKASSATVTLQHDGQTRTVRINLQ